jgi:beta-glucosidase-like glycosyl hydrolase
MSNPAQWSAADKVAQCIFPRLDTERFVEDKNYSDMMLKLSEMNIGGFCLFGGNPEQVEQMIHTLQAKAKTPLLISADFENGLQMRLSEGTDFPHALGMGKLGHEPIFKIAQAIAKEASGIGIRWNLAPVADVNTNKDNPVINIRSFGSSTLEVAQHVKSYIEGTQVEKVLACAKHFPGHGDTSSDSHVELPLLEHSYERLTDIEFAPFIEAIDANVATIMLGHLATPAIDNSLIPASLSSKVVQILREDLNFRGLIVTDALDMKAITNNYSNTEAAKMAAEAGVNILLMPENPQEVIEYLNKCAKSDHLFHEKIDISARKIVFYKRKFGLIPQYQLLESSKNLFINHAKMALQYAYDAIEKKGDESLIPLSEKVNFAGFAFVEKDREFRSASRLFTMMAQATENDCDFAYINTDIDDDEIDEFVNGVSEAELIIFTVFYRSITDNLTDLTIGKINGIMNKIAKNKKRIIINYGNPSYTDYFTGDLFVNTFSDSFSSLAASVVMLTGREEAMKY